MTSDSRITPTGKVESIPFAFEEPKRHPYVPPQLVVFGAVKQLTKGAATVGTDASAGNSRANKQSERRVKENVVQVGVHPLGIGLYLFDYKDEFKATAGWGRQFGVMVDEVETVMPEAISTNADEFKLVNYGMLGIERFVH